MPVENVLTLRLATSLRRTSVEHFARPAARQAVERAEQLEVLLRRGALVEVGRLGDEVDLAADGLELARDRVPEDARAAARRLRAAGQDADHRRLAGAVVAEQPEDLARPYAQAHAVERADVAVVLGEVRDLDGEAGGALGERPRLRGGGGAIRARAPDRILPRVPGQPTREGCVSSDTQRTGRISAYGRPGHRAVCSPRDIGRRHEWRPTRIRVNNARPRLEGEGRRGTTGQGNTPCRRPFPGRLPSRRARRCCC